jgi:serine protease Do
MLRLIALDGRTFLGVAVLEIDTERSKALKLKDEYGVEVTRVEDDSPAAKAGLRVGDVVLEYNGQRVEGTEQFVRLVRETPAGRAVKLLISRNGASQTLVASVATRKAKGYISGIPMDGMRVEVPSMEMSMPDIPKAMMSWRSSLLGVEAESLTDSQLASFFGVKEGVLVRSVMKGTTAEKAGIRAGDVLIKVDDSKVTTPRDVTGAVRSARANSKKSFSIVLMRERKELSLNVTLDDDTSAPAATPRPAQKISDKQHARP